MLCKNLRAESIVFMKKNIPCINLFYTPNNNLIINTFSKLATVFRQIIVKSFFMQNLYLQACNKITRLTQQKSPICYKNCFSDFFRLEY